MAKTSFINTTPNLKETIMSDISKRNLERIGDKGLVIDAVVKEINKSEKDLRNWKNKIVKWYDLYKMVQHKKHYEGLADIFVPEILRAVETVVGNLYKIIFSQEPWFSFAGREPSDNDSATAMNSLVDYQLDENNFKSRVRDSLRQMAITGLTVRKIAWDYEEKSRKTKVVKVTDEPQIEDGTITKKREVSVENKSETIRDVWNMEPVDLLGFHISDVTVPYDNIQKARWIGEQYKVDRQWVREGARKGWLVRVPLDNLQPKSESGEERGSSLQSDADQLKDRRNQSSGFSGGIDPKGIEIIERWGLVPAPWVHSPEEMSELELEADDMVEAVIIIGNRKEVLKLEANPYWHGQKPYLACPYIPHEFEFKGLGVSQIAEKLQEELNDTRNQVMDNKTLNLACMWLKSRGAGIKNRDLRVKPNRAIATNDMKGLMPLRPPLFTVAGVSIEGVIKEDLRQSAGAASNLQGIAQSGVNTATEAMTLNKESFARLNTVAEMYGSLVLKPGMEMVQFLNYQFYDKNKMIRIVGEDGLFFKDLDPDEIVGNKDVQILISANEEESPAVKRQQLIQFFTIVQQMPMELIHQHWEVLDKIYKSFFPQSGMKDLYEVPASKQKMLTPDQEFALVLAEIPVFGKKGQDHVSHLRQLEQDLQDVKYALKDKQLSILLDLIMSHQKLLEEEQQAEAISEMQALAGPDGQPKAPGLTPGQMPNATPFTAKQKSTTQGQVMRDSRGGA